MQRPSYEPFDPQQRSHAPLSYGNPSAGGSSGYAHAQFNQQNFGQQSAPQSFVSRYEVDQSVDSALSMLTNPDILNSLSSMVQQPLPPQQQLQQPPHAYSAPQQHYHHNGAYPPNAGPAGGLYNQRPSAPSYPPAHAMQGPGAMHDSRGQMFDGGSGQHVHRAMDAPPPHHMPHGIHPPGVGAIASRDSFPFDARVGQLPQQRLGQLSTPSRPDYKQPEHDNRAKEYRGLDSDPYHGHAAAMRSSRADVEHLAHAAPHMQGRDMGGGGMHDAFGRRGALDYRQASADASRGAHPDPFEGRGGGAPDAFRGAALGAVRAADYERAPTAGSYNYREVAANDFRATDERRNREDSRLPRAGGSLLDAYSSQSSRNSEPPRFGASAASALPSSRSGWGSGRGESLLDQYGGAGDSHSDIRVRDTGRGVGVSSRWNDRDRRSPSPPRRAAASSMRDAKFGLPSRAREPASSMHSPRFERHRSRSPVDRRGSARLPKEPRSAKGDDEVPPTKELFVGSIRDGTTEAHIHEAFSKFGPIDSLAVKTNRHFGFVNFKNLSDAVRAKREMEGKPLATSIKLSIQFTKVDARRGGDDGRPERRIEREPIQREPLDSSPAPPKKQEELQQHENDENDASSSSQSQERGASPAAQDAVVAVDEERQEQERALDEVPSVAGEQAPDS